MTLALSFAGFCLAAWRLNCELRESSATWPDGATFVLFALIVVLEVVEVWT